MKKIRLSNSELCIVSDQDYDVLNKWVWRLNKDGYAVRTVNPPKKVSYPFRRTMHEEILGKKEGLQVDHINRNRLDNARTNLRWCTKAENLRNSNRKIGATGFRGVHKDCNKYSARLCINGQSYEVRGFDSATEAARAYNEMARKYHGEFCVLNTV